MRPRAADGADPPQRCTPPSGAACSHYRELAAAIAGLDLRPSELHRLRGDVPRRQVGSHCTDFERSIRRAGGMDLALLGVGPNGHVAFNEPGSAASSKTRHVARSELTRQDAAFRFGSEALVLRHALTMGVETILEARRALILAIGAHKAPIVARLLRERPSAALPASFLGLHAAASLLSDAAAASWLGGHDGSEGWDA